MKETVKILKNKIDKNKQKIKEIEKKKKIFCFI